MGNLMVCMPVYLTVRASVSPIYSLLPASGSHRISEETGARVLDAFSESAVQLAGNLLRREPCVSRHIASLMYEYDNR